MITNVGIHGVGAFLPPTVRRNDWWPEHIVEKWRARQSQNVLRGEALIREDISEGARRTIAALAKLDGDPFEGARERRVIDEGMLPSDIEVLAAREAIARAGIQPSQIDFIMSYTPCPDDLVVSQACVVHHKLGLPERCFSVTTDVGCNAFAMQLELARGLIMGGRARFGLLTQSNTIQHRVAKEEPASAWFGDGATAVVVGPVSEGFGLLGSSHRTDGSLSRALVLGVPGKSWWDAGEITLHPVDGPATKRMLFSLVDWAKQAVGEALEQAGVRAEEIAFYSSHQATTWLRPVTQEYLGLSHARSVDIFPWTTSLTAANSPLQLALAERDGLLRRGDLAAVFSGGTGVTWSGTVMRWGV